MLGPVLFTVYIDDLEVEVERRRLEVLILKFADDTKGAKTIKGPEDRSKLQEALDCLCEWAEKWGMTFNLGKCKIMHVGRNNPRYEYFERYEAWYNRRGERYRRGHDKKPETSGAV